MAEFTKEFGEVVRMFCVSDLDESQIIETKQPTTHINRLEVERGPIELKLCQFGKPELVKTDDNTARLVINFGTILLGRAGGVGPWRQVMEWDTRLKKPFIIFGVREDEIKGLGSTLAKMVVTKEGKLVF